MAETPQTPDRMKPIRAIRPLYTTARFPKVRKNASRRGFRVLRSMKRKHIGVQRLFSAEREAKLNLRS